MKIKEVTIKIDKEQFKNKLDIQDGKDGIDGKDGVGIKGDKGDKGDLGNIPDHKWEGTKLKFEKPDGEWGAAVDLRGPKGNGGISLLNNGGNLNYWDRNATNGYVFPKNINDKIGIGTSNPLTSLDVRGDNKITVNGIQTVYVPNQTNFPGTMIFGNGGNSLTHISGEDAYFNLFTGNQSGYNNTTGHHNYFAASQAGYNNTTGSYNFLLGANSGFYGNGNHNVGLGFYTLSASYGNYNIGIGDWSGAINGIGDYSINIGGGSVSDGYNNTCIGTYTAVGLLYSPENFIGDYNCVFGSESLKSFASYIDPESGAVGSINKVLSFGYKAMYNALNYDSSNVIDYSIALGYQSLQNLIYANAIGIGDNTVVNGTKGITIGTGSSIGEYGINIGPNGSAGNNAINIGNGINEGNDNTLIFDAVNPAAGSYSDKAILYGLMDATTANQTLRINGSLGIGTSPSYILDVLQTQDGASRFQMTNASNGTNAQVLWQLVNDASNALQFGIGSSNFVGSSAAGEAYLQCNAGPIFFRSIGANYLRFGTNSTERMRIDATGNVGIGRTPSYALDVNTDIWARRYLAVGTYNANYYPGYSSWLTQFSQADQVILMNAALATSDTTGRCFAVFAGTETASRVLFHSNGVVAFGSGSASRDTYLSRSTTSTFKIAGSFDGTTTKGNLNITGGIQLGYIAKSANYTAVASDYVIECTANSFTITLPTAVGIQGKVYNIKNTGTGVITIDANSTETIDGELTQTINQWDNIEIMSNNANWIIL